VGYETFFLKSTARTHC